MSGLLINVEKAEGLEGKVMDGLGEDIGDLSKNLEDVGDCVEHENSFKAAGGVWFRLMGNNLSKLGET